VTATDPDAVVAYFGAITRSLLTAEQQAGVRHHVLLSIVGLHRVEGNAHYAGGVDERGELAVGDLVSIRPEPAHGDDMGGRFLRVVAVGPHAKAPPGTQTISSSGELGRSAAPVVITRRGPRRSGQRPLAASDIFSIAWSMVKLAAFCRGGKSLKVARNSATNACAARIM
jgi:hypothetical protein